MPFKYRHPDHRGVAETGARGPFCAAPARRKLFQAKSYSNPFSPTFTVTSFMSSPDTMRCNT